jgi:hypothetical protein
MVAWASALADGRGPVPRAGHLRTSRARGDSPCGLSRLRDTPEGDDHGPVQRTSRPISALLFALSASLAGAGCVSPYVTATERFGASTSAGVAAFTPIFDTASELCFRDAELEHLQARLEDRGRGWGTEPLLGEIRSQGKVKVLEPGSNKVVEESVSERCGRLEVADAVLSKGLSALADYGRALQSLAANMAVDSKGLKELAASGQSLGAMLSQNPTSTKAQTETMVQLVGPLGELARVIAQSEVESDLKATILRSDPHVAVILGKARLYVKATRAEARSAQSRMETLLNTADQKVQLALREPRDLREPPAVKPAPPAPPATSPPAPPPAKPRRPGDKVEAPAPPPPPPPALTLPEIEGALGAAIDRAARHRPVLGASVTPQDVFALYAFAARERRRSADLMKTLDSFDSILDGLARAESDLVAAAGGKTSEKEALDRVFVAANGVLAQIEVLKALASRKE